MELAIAQNPHITEEDDRRAIWDMLDSMLDFDSVPSVKTEDRTEEFNPNEFDRLKLAMADNPKIVIKS